jgi:16S rRNA U516 pseudouridylate synthase RsuA-like enzyme
MLESVTRALRIGKLERIDKLLSMRGAGTRSEVDAFLKQGRVFVDGNVIKKRGTRLPIETHIAINDKVYHSVPVLAVFHKPMGMISSMQDKWERMDLSKVEESYPFLKSMHPVVSFTVAKIPQMQRCVIKCGFFTGAVG